MTDVGKQRLSNEPTQPSESQVIGLGRQVLGLESCGLDSMSVYQGRLNAGAGGHLPPSDSLVASSQIQKLADHSNVISEVPKCSKIQIFRGSPLRIPLGELIALPRSPN